MIRTALDEAKAVKGTVCPYWQDEPASPHAFQSWDDAIMARDWIARETPNVTVDPAAYLLSFAHACEVLGLDADYEATWMLQTIDSVADFDAEEVHARIQYLTENPPDDVEEPLFEPFRVVPVLDQGCLFSAMAA